MKTILIFTATVLMLITSSCYSTKYTHNVVMDTAIKGRSKEQILNIFGFPTEKKTEGNYELWVYDLGQRTVSLNLPSSTNANVTVDPYSNSANHRFSR
ncbi:MAG: hypothetical protein Q7J06_05020 [Bacteroidales bacterium]|nr:hypothetical protein [Bacteroidales bacterium]